MKIDWKNPIVLSVISYIVMFTISIFVLAFSKPKYVKKMKNGVIRIDYILLIVYSLLFGSISAITVLILLTDNSNHIPNSNQPVNYVTNYVT